jgi:hypothetical protein
MATVDKPAAESMSDLDYAIHLILTGRKDPGFVARVQKETARITEEIESKHGVLNVAVGLVREARDEE